MTRRIAWAGLATIAVLTAVIFFPRGRSPVERQPQQEPLTHVSLRLPIPAVDGSFVPYYLAIDRGFFSSRGLDVSLEPGSPELNPIKMLAQGTDQFGVVGGPELLFSGRAKGAPLVGIALLHKNSNFVVLLTLKKSGITQLDQLQGKKVGFFYGHISTDILHMLFAKNKINVKEVDVGFDYSQLLSGNLAAEWAFRTTAGVSLPARGVELNTINPADYGIQTQGHTIFTTERMIHEHPDIVTRFLAAVLDATAYSLTHVDEGVASMIKRDPTMQPSVAEKQIVLYNETIRANSRIGWIASEDMERTKQQMVDVSLLPPSFDVSAAYTTRFLDQYYAPK